MDVLIYALVLIAALSLMVVVHEFGHFVAAKAAGVQVLQFNVGVGPTLFKRIDSAGTEYKLAAIPLGGFAGIRDERLHGAGGGNGLSFQEASPRWRLVIALAGSGANFVAAFLILLVIALATGTKPATVIEISESEGRGFEAGLRSGDVITKVDGTEVARWSDVGVELLSRVGDTGAIEMEVSREGSLSTHAIAITDWQSDVRQMDVFGYLGIGQASALPEKRTPLLSRFVEPVVETWNAGIAIAAAGFKMIFGDMSFLNFGGPLPLAVLGLDNPGLMKAEDRAGLSFTDYLALFAVFSIALGIINLLPGPVVDGANVIAASLEMVSGKPLSAFVDKSILYVGSVFGFGPLVICIGYETLRFF